MKKTLITLFFLIASLFSGMGFVDAAETNVDYIPLVDLPGVSKSSTDKSVTLQTYIPGVFKLSIGIAGVLAVLMIVFGGFEYITSESLGGKSGGRERINNALIGLLLVIGSYAILSTISPELLSFNLNVKSLPTQQTGGGADWGDETPVGTGGNWPSDNIDRADLKNRNIDVNKTNCTKEGDKNESCTSVYNIGDKVINGLEALQKACGCKIVITGGTEYWHHSPGTRHRPGGNVVDIRLDAPLDFFRKNPQYKINDTSCKAPGTERYGFAGGVYVNETGGDPHFHVCF